MDLLKKLHVNIDKPLWVINAPANCLYLFDGLTIKQKTGKEKPVSQLIVFLTSSNELVHYIDKLAPYIGHETLFWIAWPKKSGAVSSDLIHMKSWDVVFNSGYRGQTSVSINDNWTGFRVTNAPPKKPPTYGIAPEDRNVEGIDFVKRTVQLPADALVAVRRYKGLENYFNSLAFTHKKEHVMAILDAKKVDTRRRRIEKMIEMLQQKMHIK